jgi:hypothetical protein
LSSAALNVAWYRPVTQMNSTVLLASVFLPIPLNAFALRFEPPTPCVWYAVHHGQLTFIGKVLSEETVADLLEFGEHVTPVTVQKVKIEVEEPFDGTPGKTETVYGSGATK